MANIINFNKHRPPILPLLMPDEQTLLNLCPPTKDLVDELREGLSDLRALLNQEDEEMVYALYDLAARLMSCNRNLKKITVEQLRNTYNMDIVDLTLFFQKYADYIVEIENLKN